jgi:hypothetical protein
MILDVFLQEMKELSEKKPEVVGFLPVAAPEAQECPRKKGHFNRKTDGKRMENGWNRVP